MEEHFEPGITEFLSSDSEAEFVEAAEELSSDEDTDSFAFMSAATSVNAADETAAATASTPVLSAGTATDASPGCGAREPSAATSSQAATEAKKEGGEEDTNGGGDDSSDEGRGDAAATAVASARMDEEAARRAQEEQDCYDALSETERQAQEAEAEALKVEGNALFGAADFASAIDKYSAAIRLGPSKREATAPFYANRGACYFKLEKYADCVVDCSTAIEIKPDYAKAICRRAMAYEKQDKLEEALKDFKTVLELEPSNAQAQTAIKRIPPLIEEQREKLKTEMFGKLKELGNMCLKPFGLSTSNFEFVQDSASGGYSVKFKQ